MTIAKTLAEAKLILDRQRRELDPARPEDLKLYVERDMATHQALITEALSAVESKRPFRWFFTGHTGAGKSTELNRIVRDTPIQARYIPHIFRVRDNLDVHNLDYTDLILGIAQSVSAIAETREVSVPKALRERMAKWGTETELETELGLSGSAKGTYEFNALVFKAGAEIQAGSEKRKVIREKLRETLTDFIKLIDDLVTAIEKKAKKRVLVVIDTLDHVDHRPIRDIFTNHFASVTRPNVSLLIVVPLPMVLEQQFMASVESNYSLLPNIKVFKGPGSLELDESGYRFFREVISRLADISLFTDDAFRDLCRLSCGLLRDMIGSCGAACGYADSESRKGTVEPKHVQYVLDERKAFYRRLLKQADYEVLRRVAANPRPMGNDGLASLLHLKAIINYPNGEGWYGLHPAVQAILDTAAR